MNKLINPITSRRKNTLVLLYYFIEFALSIYVKYKIYLGISTMPNVSLFVGLTNRVKPSETKENKLGNKFNGLNDYDMIRLLYLNDLRYRF